MSGWLRAGTAPKMRCDKCVFRMARELIHAHFSQTIAATGSRYLTAISNCDLRCGMVIPHKKEAFESRIFLNEI